MKARHYPNLSKRDGRKGWVFRKYSCARRAEFTLYTGEDRAADAYAKGMREFAKWNASTLKAGPKTTIRDVALSIIAEGAGRENTLRSKHRHLRDHVIPNFGHMLPSEVTNSVWVRYDQAERRKGRTSLFNNRKYLVECLHKAKEARLIDSVPRLQRLDPEAAPPKEIPYQDYRAIRRSVAGFTKLLVFVMYWQGARPGEVLRYKWDMIDWVRGTITIPGSITKTKRARTIPINRRVRIALKRLRRENKSQWVFPSPARPGEPVYAYWTPWLNGLSRLADEGRPMDYSIYNLRDTYITRQIRRGVHTTIIAKYCDTSAKEIEKRYAAINEDMMRQLD